MAVVAETGPVIITGADWLPGDTSLFFWECRECECAFGPLRADRGQAEAEGREHLAEEHAQAARKEGADAV